MNLQLYHIVFFITAIMFVAMISKESLKLEEVYKAFYDTPVELHDPGINWGMYKGCFEAGLVKLEISHMHIPNLFPHIHIRMHIGHMGKFGICVCDFGQPCFEGYMQDFNSSYGYGWSQCLYSCAIGGYNMAAFQFGSKCKVCHQLL